MKITYKGTSIIQGFDYKCEGCSELSVVEQKRSDDMRNRVCGGCGAPIARYITKAPALDADYHQAHKSYNIGWSSEC